MQNEQNSIQKQKFEDANIVIQDYDYESVMKERWTLYKTYEASDELAGNFIWYIIDKDGNYDFENIKESVKLQHEKDVKAFNEVKEKSAQENKEFAEFLQTKGFKAKVKLVIENIKKGASEANEKTKMQIAKANELAKPSYNKNTLSNEFNAFLKSKGLDSKYIVTIEEVGE